MSEQRQTILNNRIVKSGSRSETFLMLRWRDHNEVEREKRASLRHLPPRIANGNALANGRALAFSDHEQIHIAVAVGNTVGVGTKEDHLLRLELLGKNAQVRQQFVGDPVDK